jgi:hypothetical protein
MILILIIYLIIKLYLSKLQQLLAIPHRQVNRALKQVVASDLKPTTTRPSHFRPRPAAAPKPASTNSSRVGSIFSSTTENSSGSTSSPIWYLNAHCARVK